MLLISIHHSSGYYYSYCFVLLFVPFSENETNNNNQDNFYCYYNLNNEIKGNEMKNQNKTNKNKRITIASLRVCSTCTLFSSSSSSSSASCASFPFVPLLILLLLLLLFGYGGEGGALSLYVSVAPKWRNATDAHATKQKQNTCVYVRYFCSSIISLYSGFYYLKKFFYIFTSQFCSDQLL